MVSAANQGLILAGLAERGWLKLGLDGEYVPLIGEIRIAAAACNQFNQDRISKYILLFSINLIRTRRLTLDELAENRNPAISSRISYTPQSVRCNTLGLVPVSGFSPAQQFLYLRVQVLVPT